MWPILRTPPAELQSCPTALQHLTTSPSCLLKHFQRPCSWPCSTSSPGIERQLTTGTVMEGGAGARARMLKGGFILMYCGSLVGPGGGTWLGPGASRAKNWAAGAGTCRKLGGRESQPAGGGKKAGTGGRTTGAPVGRKEVRSGQGWHQSAWRAQSWAHESARHGPQRHNVYKYRRSQAAKRAGSCFAGRQGGAWAGSGAAGAERRQTGGSDADRWRRQSRPSPSQARPPGAGAAAASQLGVVGVQQQHRPLGVGHAVLRHGAQQQLLDGPLVVRGHHQRLRAQLRRLLADRLADVPRPASGEGGAGPAQQRHVRKEADTGLPACRDP